MATSWRPTLADYVETAAVILEADPESIEQLPGLAIIEHLARNHPLPDGNKRTALALTILFLERNGEAWGEPDHDRDVGMVERIAGGEADQVEIRDWIADRSAGDST